MSPGVFQAVEFAFECRLPNGLHARPASHLSETANRFASDCVLTNLRNGAHADLKSVLATIAADVRAGDACSVKLEGSDSDAAASALRQFIETELPACDEPLAEAVPIGATPALPRSLAGEGAKCHAALPVSNGIGFGGVVVLGRITPAAVPAGGPVVNVPAERERLESALAAMRARIEGLSARMPGSAESAILKAHLAILGDVTLGRELTARVDLGRTAAQAVVEAFGHFSGLLKDSENAYIRERAVDVQELCTELLEEICGPEFQPAGVELREPSIIVAETLAPHQLLNLNRALLAGIVVESAGATSHAMILARSLGIPAVAGLTDASRFLAAGQPAIVDGNRGFVFASPAPAVLRFYQRERAAMDRRQATLARFGAAPAITADGVKLDIGANVASTDELAPAFASGADGIGLFRTEILFARRATPPSEDEQFAIYSQAVRAAAGRPVIFRTIDAGGDKPLAYLHLGAERNPFLGYRGIRIYPEYRELVATQIRAALRASAEGVVWLMAPMVSSIEEARWFKREVTRAKSELAVRGIAFDVHMPLGAMIEVPAAAFAIAPLAAELEFFSIGTNDLSQYFFAADRENATVSGVANVRSPAFLRFLRQIADEVRAHGKWLGMCGEMAADPRNLPLIVGLGIDEISVSSNAIATLKQKAAALTADVCRELLAQAIDCGASEEVERLLDFAPALEAPKPLLDRELVMLSSDSRDKDEAIHEIVDVLYAAGRVENPQQLEDAVWARETVYATGVGHGFAIPHCKTDAVGANSIGILKLREPIAWGSLDGAPVRMVIFLAVRESGQNGLHMKVFSRLARKLMDENFRERLIGIDDPGEMVSHVANELDGHL